MAVINNDGFIKSENIWVFPSSYRSKNIESKINTEYNLTRGSAVGLKDNYVVKAANNTYEVVLGGYFIKFTLADDDADFNYIYLQKVSLSIDSDPEYNVYGTSEFLQNLNNTAEANVMNLDSDGYFYGVKFTKTEPTAASTASAKFYALNFKSNKDIFSLDYSDIGAVKEGESIIGDFYKEDNNGNGIIKQSTNSNIFLKGDVDLHKIDTNEISIIASDTFDITSTVEGNITTSNLNIKGTTKLDITGNDISLKNENNNKININQDHISIEGNSFTNSAEEITLGRTDDTYLEVSNVSSSIIVSAPEVYITGHNKLTLNNNVLVNPATTSNDTLLEVKAVKIGDVYKGGKIYVHKEVATPTLNLLVEGNEGTIEENYKISATDSAQIIIEAGRAQDSKVSIGLPMGADNKVTLITDPEATTSNKYLSWKKGAKQPEWQILNKEKFSTASVDQNIYLCGAAKIDDDTDYMSDAKISFDGADQKLEIAKIKINTIESDNTTLTINSNIRVKNDVTATNFYANSDRRLKENFREFNPNKSILDLPIYKYDFIGENMAKDQIGCIAQDLLKLYPELVYHSTSGYFAIQESKLIYPLILEVKKLKEEIEKLKK